MKLQFAQVPTKEQIKAALEQHLPQFQYSFRIGKMVDCKQTFFIGATVVPKKDGIVINSNFPSPGANMFFTLFMLATGILVGLVLWLIAWKPGQDKVRDQVARVLGQVFGATNPLPAAPGQPQLAQGQPQMAHGQPQMQQPQAQGFAPGMQVFVAPGDGQRYPATVVSTANGQYQCMMPNGQPYWFPAQNVSVS